MIELLIVRHGQSLADIEHGHEGRADFVLTDLGRRQAKEAALWITTHYPPGTILSSPVLRAAETAEIIATELGLPVTFDDALMEMNNGMNAGLTFEEAKVRYPRPEAGWTDHEGQPE